MMADGTWTCRVRHHDLRLIDPVDFTSATLEENYNLPDTLVVTGRLDTLRPGLLPGYGCVLQDPAGTRRFSGVATYLDRHGDGTGSVTYTGDLVRLRDRIIWPVYNAAWATSAQTSAYDIQTAAAETRLLTYINRNAGSIAYNSAGVDRRVANLRLPSSAGRGPNARTSARFNNLLELAAQLAEQAGLRLNVVQTYEGTSRYLDVTLTAVPDVSASVRFGDPTAGGPAMLSNDWRYAITAPSGTAMLSGAENAAESRILNAGTPDADAEALWHRRIEVFVDQRQTGDSTEIVQGLADALRDNAGAVEVNATVSDASEVALGVTSSPDDRVAVPVGSTVSAVLDGEIVTERIRVLRTVIATGGDATVRVTPVIGTQDAVFKSLTQRRLANAMRRISMIERSQ